MEVTMPGMQLTKLILIFLLTTVSLIQGQTLELSGSSNLAKLNHSFTLTCTVNEAVELEDKIVFHHKTNLKFAVIYQDLFRCFLLSPPPFGYKFSCGQDNFYRSTNTKVYKMTIERVQLRDATKWWCVLDKAQRASNSLKLNIEYFDDYEMHDLFGRD